MSEFVDIGQLLESWPYDADHNVRIGRGDDGREILQVRTLMGLEQYELEGRPDGQRPHGMESALEYHLQRLDKARAAGQEDSFVLPHNQCVELFAEGTLFYYRYLHCFQAREWKRTLRDTTRNLRLFDFVRRYAESESDQMHLERWRPYILRMNAAAAAMLALESELFERAQVIIRGALDRLEALPELDDETFQYERKRSLLALREMAEQIQKNLPLSEHDRLEQELQQAIEQQAFERAAQLRDRLRALKKTS
jgi:hypothetical protein